MNTPFNLGYDAFYGSTLSRDDANPFCINELNAWAEFNRGWASAQLDDDMVAMDADYELEVSDGFDDFWRQVQSDTAMAATPVFA